MKKGATPLLATRATAAFKEVMLSRFICYRYAVLVTWQGAARFHFTQCTHTHTHTPQHAYTHTHTQTHTKEMCSVIDLQSTVTSATWLLCLVCMALLLDFAVWFSRLFTFFQKWCMLGLLMTKLILEAKVPGCLEYVPLYRPQQSHAATC